MEISPREHLFEKSSFLKRWLIDSQFYVALMGTFFAVFFMLRENFFNWSVITLIFITYFCGYSYTEFQYSKKINRVLVLNAVAALICIVILFYEKNEYLFYRWLLICGLGILYDSVFLQKLNLRKIPFLKIFYVALVWALINGWLVSPTFYWGSFWITLLFITALLLPYDIRDMNRDRGRVVTFPLRFGILKTKMLAVVLLLLASGLMYHYFTEIYFIAFALTLVITSILILFTKQNYRDFYFSFWLETCSGLPLIFVWLLNYL